MDRQANAVAYGGLLYAIPALGIDSDMLRVSGTVNNDSMLELWLRVWIWELRVMYLSDMFGI